MPIGRVLRPVLFSLAVAAGGAAQAVVTVHTTQASFLAAVLNPGTDTFDNLTVGSFVASPLSRSAGQYGYTARASTLDFFVAGSAGDSRLSTNEADDTITFQGFGPGVAAIGGFFFGSDLFGNALSGQSVRLDVTDADGTLQYALNGAGSTSFVGFVASKPLQSLVLTAVQSIDFNVWATANNLVLAAAVPAIPEPSPTILLAAGLGVLALRRWRGSRQDG